MRAKRTMRVLASIATLAATATFLAASAQAAPVKLVSSTHITAGLRFPAGVAVAPSGHIYVVDSGYARVQELTASGEFVLMFGKGVNKKGGVVCLKAEASECQAGIEGSAAGQIASASSVAVSPSGEVYVAEDVFGEGKFGERVQEFTAEGLFVLEIGKEVNETTKGNFCSQEEVEKGVKCGAPRLYPFSEPPVSEPGAFDFQQFMGDLLAVGGPKSLLYVGDNGRVQEFESSSGKRVGEIPVACRVGAIAVDEAGDVYALCNQLDTIEEFNPSGAEIDSFSVSPREKGNEIAAITGIALDSAGNLAVSAYEHTGPGNAGGSQGPFGLLFDAATGHLITNFTIAGENTFSGMAFDLGDHLYATDNDEILLYGSVNVGELLTAPATCKAGPDIGTDATLDCLLDGSVDAWGVKGTKVWFEWGETPQLGMVTGPQAIANEKPNEGEEEEPVPASAPITGLTPNSTLYARLAGEDANVMAPELLTSETASLHTPRVAPRIVGEASASFVSPFSAVLYGQLNPENANTEYFFEYAPADACPSLEGCSEAAATSAETSRQYGLIATTMEAQGLRAATTYRYRLSASNAQEVNKAIEGGQAKGLEGSFTTAAAPLPSAASGAASGIGATSAMISGTVDPAGQPATYAFELGVYAPAGTSYGVVFSGPAGSSTTPVEKTLALTGLQPGTTYAYRIKISSGFGVEAGQAVTFTTQGLPTALNVPTVLPILATPPIAFPKGVGKPAPKCKHGYTRNKHGKCVKAKAKKKSGGKGAHGKKK